MKPIAWPGLDGRTVSSGPFDGSLLLDHAASGMYFLSIENTTALKPTVSL
ncbi:MAG: hypothetical protein IPP25_15020 [Saprospiraceae bacterium]|nr:hypothetical protein [Candidatus Opimibacter skivensis]